MSASVPSNSAKTSFVVNDASQDIPIFLRKTYHMVDTCEKSVCAWSEDGETFIVKHPKKFEQEVIPQFFKHRKFSSFVRQLNFYAFRKIKTNDSIRIDATLEAATANYWRFFHPKFQRGKPEWLQEIKRSSSTPRGSGTKKAAGSGAAAKSGTNKVATPDAVESSAVVGEENIELKLEVTSLKERVEAMTKSIDMLTNLVENVSISKKIEGNGNVPIVNENNKRPKITATKFRSEQTHVSKTVCVPDSISSNISVPDEARSTPSPSYPDAAESDSGLASLGALEPNISGDESSVASNLIMDQNFADSLLNFNHDDDEDGIQCFLNPDPIHSSSGHLEGASNNQPRVELMNRLSDALSLLPQEIQELIVDRLIQAITSPKEIRESLQVTAALQEVVETASAATSNVPMSVPQSPRHQAASCDDSAMMMDDASVVPTTVDTSLAHKPVLNPSLPLAAATLAALLSQYSENPQCTAAVVAATNTLIPVHV
uniref:HSF-type DNA-binding domain-containing protein n=2 Tax=Pseudo-nitzschia australis TaxID=44445 RepID=A0A7S4EFZ6_9STRA|mmetsp:Transcript_3228/g.6970  ORF Transcript_3228/g.6970 Transcript_3228/m.6970 type:complete len:487 (-) Transcript_3228:516-1976(-)